MLESTGGRLRGVAHCAFMANFGYVILGGVVVALVAWAALAVGLFFLLQRVARRRRLEGSLSPRALGGSPVWISAGVFLGPIVIFGGSLAVDWVRELRQGPPFGPTREPLSLMGATFPPGSGVVYSDYHGKAVDVLENPRGVQWGPLRITRIQPMGPSEGDEALAWVYLQGSQRIDGWLCREGSAVGIRCRGGQPISLRSCVLAEAVAYRGTSWAPGAELTVRRSGRVELTGTTVDGGPSGCLAFAPDGGVTDCTHVSGAAD